MSFLFIEANVSKMADKSVDIKMCLKSVNFFPDQNVFFAHLISVPHFIMKKW